MVHEISKEAQVKVGGKWLFRMSVVGLGKCQVFLKEDSEVADFEVVFFSYILFFLI